MTRQFHRPARLDPEAAQSLLVTEDTAVASELAHRTAALLLGAADDGDLLTRQAVVDAVARHGVDDVAQMWASSPATTLPGALWRLFLVREWVRRDPDLVERRYATTVDLRQDPAAQERLSHLLRATQADQVRPVPSPEQVREVIDQVLAGALTDPRGELARVLTVAAAFLRALAAGSTPVWIEDDADELAVQVTRRDSALLRTAEELSEAARRAASGNLD